MSARDLSETSALAETDPCADLAPDAPDAMLRAAWARFDARLAASLSADWHPGSGRYRGFDVFARSRVYLVATGITDAGITQVLVDIRPDLPEPLRARLGRTAGGAGAAIFARLAQVQPLTILRAASLEALAPNAA